MTLDELAFQQRKAVEAGWSADQVAAMAEWARDWRIDRRLYGAVKRALATIGQSPVLAAAPSAESGFIVAVKPDSPVVVAPELPFHTSPEKSAARACLLVALPIPRRSGPAKPFTPTEREVCGRLLEHLNLDTGRCDPSIGSGLPGDRGMATALGRDPRSVRRAIAGLIDAGLVERDQHVGRGHTNSYRLNLAAMASIAARAAPGAKPDSRENRTLESAKPDSRVRQNRGIKQTSQMPRPFDPAQRELRLLAVVEKSDTSKRRVAAEMGAHRRIRDDIEREVRANPDFNVSSLSDGQWAQAREVESQKYGRGIVLIRTFVAEATGPPKAAGAVG